MNFETCKKIIENIQIGVLVFELEDPNDNKSLRIIFANQAASDAIGNDFSQFVGQTLYEAFPDIYEKTDLPNLYVEVIQTGKSKDIGEIEYGDNNANHTIYHVKASPIGKNLMFIAYEDIGPRKKAEDTLKAFNAQLEEKVADRTASLKMANKFIDHKLKQTEILLEDKSALLKEVHHRVGNTMSVILSLLSMEAAQYNSKDVEKFSENIKLKLKTILFVHNKLQTNNRFSEISAKDVVAEFLPSLQAEHQRPNCNIEFKILSDDIQIDFQDSVSFGMIISEIIVNSLKYAFPDRNQGTISFKMEKKSDQDLYLEISDDGIGMPKPFDEMAKTTFGLQLISILVESEFNGKLICENKPGTTYKMELKMSERKSHLRVPAA